MFCEEDSKVRRARFLGRGKVVNTEMVENMFSLFFLEYILCNKRATECSTNILLKRRNQHAHT